MSTEIRPAELYREEAINIITASNLHASDLPGTLNNFFVYLLNSEVIGVIGLEIYNDCGLLRSLAVSSQHQNVGIGGQLIAKIEAFASTTGLKALYLLTETAKEYFENKGYEHVARMDIPNAIKESSQFTSLCPDSAIAMKKYLA